MPGGRGFNPKQMNRMMKQLGINVEEVDDVEKVIIRTATKDIIIENASVSIMDAQGQRTFQVVGEPHDAPRGEGGETAPAEPAEPAAPAAPTDEDIELVMEQAGVDRDKALEALEKADGEPAQAIMDLLE